jgi:hypothetical protein
MADFPLSTMTAKPDTAKYSVSVKNPAVRAEMEGGLVFVRARYKRRPRRTFSFGFTNISEVDKELLLQFFESKKGSGESFTYEDWASGETVEVIFVDSPNFVYAGRGDYKRWNVDGVVLEEV